MHGFYPVSVFQVPELQVCTTTTSLLLFINTLFFFPIPLIAFVFFSPWPDSAKVHRGNQKLEHVFQDP